MSVRDLRLALVVVLAAALGTVVLASGGADEAVLSLLPALALLAPLLAGRYLGEERIARLARARRPVSRPRPA
ncbi:MAG TPA: hypothetical protein VHB30_07355, partial [Solirubrobacteraceae bacterium]|nr:hypothetical protein [Solirubrobacteraceae bacterium]